VDDPGFSILMTATINVSDLHYSFLGLLKLGVAVYTIVRKWKWLVMNGCECNGMNSTMKI
jgi:hypothetical protein